MYNDDFNFRNNIYKYLHISIDDNSTNLHISATHNLEFIQ